MKEKPLISVIIPTKDREKLLGETLRNLQKASEGISLEVIVVNDDKGRRPAIPSGDHVLVDNRGSGVASARNHGASLAKGEWLLFLDDDMLIFAENFNSYQHHTFQKGNFTVNIDWTYPPDIIAHLKQNSFGRFLIKFGFTNLEGWNRGLTWKKNEVFEGTGITSQNLLISKHLFLSTGGYPENIPFAGFEDHVFSEKLKAKGVKFLIDTNSAMFHNETDRLQPKAWYARKERGGKTRKAAVEMGHTELDLSFSTAKKIYYSISPLTSLLLKTILFVTSRSKIADPISFACYKGLLGIAIYKGFSTPYSSKL